MQRMRRPSYVSTKVAKEHSHEGTKGDELARVGAVFERKTHLLSHRIQAPVN